MTCPLRVVLDTNAVLSALLFRGGASARLRAAWQQGACDPLVSHETARELIRVLTYPKFRLTPDEQQQLLADYLPYTRSVRIPDPPPPVPACRDPHDAPFLHLATAGHARVLVTGDLDLHALTGRVPFAVSTPAGFLEALQNATLR